MRSVQVTLIRSIFLSRQRQSDEEQRAEGKKKTSGESETRKLRLQLLDGLVLDLKLALHPLHFAPHLFDIRPQRARGGHSGGRGGGHGATAPSLVLAVAVAVARERGGEGCGGVVGRRLEERRGLVLVRLVVVPDILPVMAGEGGMVSIARAWAMAGVGGEGGGVGDGGHVIAVVLLIRLVAVAVAGRVARVVGRGGGCGFIEEAHEIGVSGGAVRGHRGDSSRGVSCWRCARGGGGVGGRVLVVLRVSGGGIISRSSLGALDWRETPTRHSYTARDV